MVRNIGLASLQWKNWDCLNLPEGKAAGLDSRNVKQYEYTNSKGEKVTIRQDNKASYPDGGTQPPHFNAGEKDPLKQHHNYGK